MEDLERQFVGRLTAGPAFLLLGQDYLSSESGRDAFLTEALRKYGDAAAGGVGYWAVFDGSASADPEEALAWMDERCRRLSAPPWLLFLAQYAWSGVFSSAVDSIWASAFRNSWREIEPVFDDRYRPPDPRNRFRLHCTYLFGSVNRTELDQRPPLTKFELLSRRMTAIALLRRLPELLTPRGTLAIEGYSVTDWLAPDDLLGALAQLVPGQIHLFSANAETLSHPTVAEFTKQKRLVAHSVGLDQVLREADLTGVIKVGVRPEEEGQRGTLRLGDRFHSLPKALWLQVQQSAELLDENRLLDPPPISDDALYRDFRNFLATADGKPSWSGYARGFPFRRDFEDHLLRLITQRLNSNRLVEEPVVLHGATGTGKTTALASLAYRIAHQRKWPVLYVERRPQGLLASDLDRFFQWVEDQGVQASLVVWDGMLSSDDYAEFLRRLTARGRKVALVGSSYRSAEGHGASFVAAPDLIQGAELARFRDHLKKFDTSLDTIVLDGTIRPDPTFLAALYRLLPPSRPSVRAGLSRELAHTEKVIGQHAKTARTEYRPAGALAEALFKVGLATSEQLDERTTRIVGGETVTEVQDLTGLIMVPGRFGLRVPVEVLLRALGHNEYLNLVEIMRNVDIFRWFEDSVGNIEIGPRTSLEARLLVQARLGAAATEVAYARRLLVEISDGDSGYGTTEIDFAVDLVRAMGAQAQDHNYFAPYFRLLSGALRDLRLGRAVENPRLMLQEANLLREWVISESRHQVPTEQGLTELHSVEEVIRRALELAPPERRTGTIRGPLFIELAATLAAESRQLAMLGRRNEAAELFKQSTQVLLEARSEDPSSYHAVDVLAWSTRNALDGDLLAGADRVEAIAQVLYAFETTNSDELDPSQYERFHLRRQNFADFIGNQPLGDDAFKALYATGSGAGVYLRALQMSDLTKIADRPSSEQLALLEQALAYLDQFPDLVRSDFRCNRLKFDIWWLMNVRVRPFSGERMLVNLSPEKWRTALELLRLLQQSEPDYNQISLAFLRGLALFHLNDVAAAIEVFREVERSSEQVRGRRRIVRSYLATGEDGKARQFHGSVAWASPDGRRGQAYVEELRRQIAFIPRDFNLDRAVRGQGLGEFHVAFNFLGPICDPPAFIR